MFTDDFKAINQFYPEMILVCKQPATWQGFLTVLCNSKSGQNIRIKLKLIVPRYPLLHDAEIYFGKEITFVRNDVFSQKLKHLTRNLTKVSSFLKQLQSLISSVISDTHVIKENGYESMDSTAIEILQELTDVLNISSDVQILSDNILKTIKMTFKNVAVKLQRAKFGQCPWMVIHSDLPEVPTFVPFEKNLTTLSIARNKLITQVEILEKAWYNLKQIDENCWVIDPVQPKSCYLYRRIYLTPSLSMYVKIDPLHPMDLPTIKFMGSEFEVESKKEIVSKNLHDWNPRCNIIENLMVLLDTDRFPTKEERQYIEDNDAIVTDEECCICFSLELGNETLPDKVCNNEKCRRHFHTSCLLQWLQAVAGNHVAFDYIHGSCPNCQESISCCIK